MRIAVQISGQPRAYKQGYEYLKKNLLDKGHEVDIFIHTWKNPVYDWMDVKSLYSPVTFEAEPPLGKVDHLYPNTPDAKNWPPTATVSSFYSIFKANQMRVNYEISTGTDYDLVFRTRFDFAFPFLNRLVDYLLPYHMIFVPGDRQTPRHDFCNDQFAFGSPAAITDYCQTYQYLRHFYNAGWAMIGEDMLAANLKRAGLTGIGKLNYVDIPHPFPPGPYNGSYHSLIRDDMDKWRS